jgi:enoyl-CoA hydratase/carnithine racemase
VKSLEEYADKYANLRMERRNGILQVTFHTGGRSMEWGEVPHRELVYAFADIGSDPETRVVILTGVDDSFIAVGGGQRLMWQEPTPGSDKNASAPALWYKTSLEAKRMLINLLDIEVPIISAVNGQSRVHCEVALVPDIVLAREDSVFQDAGHFPWGFPPGDGSHVIYPLLMGVNRARYFLMTGREVWAQEALELGLVNEVLPKDKLLPRAWELAEQLAEKPTLTLRYTRVVLNLRLKSLLQDMLGYGLAVEGLAALDDTPAGE